MVNRAELERVRYVTAHFEVLQGLAVLPVALGCGVAMAWAAGWISGWVVPVVAVIAAAATVAATRHYRRTYGQVRPRPGKARDTFLLWPTAGLITVVALAHAVGPHLSISPEGVVLSVGALAGAWFQRPLAPAFLLIGCAGLVLSLAPLGGPGGPHPLSDTENWIILFCAGVAVLAGWGHLLLRRTLGRGRHL
ncbi:hypothetical protein [Microtetraspora niveoalba]|uniref:hypothetical protein n=1 Tax=Microtetraspora niveoalba TaxID=46175 RepID=UPI000829561D|nr:hypothetical protein [Microtetraspora niveoalba]